MGGFRGFREFRLLAGPVTESGPSVRVAGGKTTDHLSATHSEGPLCDSSCGPSSTQAFRFYTFPLCFIKRMCSEFSFVYSNNHVGSGREVHHPTILELGLGLGALVGL